MSSLYDQLHSAEQRLNSIQAEIDELREKIKALANIEQTPQQNDHLQLLEADVRVLNQRALEVEKNYGILLAKEQALSERLDG